MDTTVTEATGSLTFTQRIDDATGQRLDDAIRGILDAAVCTSRQHGIPAPGYGAVSITVRHGWLGGKTWTVRVSDLVLSADSVRWLRRVISDAFRVDL